MNVIYITSRVPGITVTFISNEIMRLRKMGVNVQSYCMNTPPLDHVPRGARELYETTVYLDKINLWVKLLGFAASAVSNPLRMVKCILHLLSASPVKFPRDFLRLGYHLIEAGYIREQTRNCPPDHVHSHLVNGPTSISMFFSILSGVPYSFTMHASMIWLDPIGLRNKLRTALFCVSISEFNRQYVIGAYGTQHAEKIHVIHCGVDEETMPAPPAQRPRRGVLRILGVGQLNPRKGFQILLPSLAVLRDRGLRFQCTIVGEGDQRPILERQIGELGLSGFVELAGSMLHEEVKRLIPMADIFVLPCVISADGYRDGIPVALMEAMYYERAVVSTSILGLPELIDDGVSGILVPAGDASRLADALDMLSKDEELRKVLGRNAKAKVLLDFNNARSARMLLELFRRSSDTPH